MHLVVKTPVTSPYLAELFKPAISFVKEVRFYSDIIPAVKQFEQESNIPEDERLDAFIQCLGWRISLDPSKFHVNRITKKNQDSFKKKIKISDAQSADADAVLLLDNIKLQNYANGDKFVGFDVEETMATLKVQF